jgi:hypothetical protein
MFLPANLKTRKEHKEVFHQRIYKDGKKEDV